MRRIQFRALSLACAFVLGHAVVNCSADPDAATADGTRMGEAGVDAAAAASVCLAPALQAAAWAGTAECPAPIPAARDGFDDALAVQGLTRCDLKFATATANLSGFPPASTDPHRLPDFDALHLGPLRLPSWVGESSHWLSEALEGPTPVTSSIAVASLRRGHAVEGCLALDAYSQALAPGAPSPLATALGVIVSAHGGEADADANAEATSQVPIDLQRALVPVIAALDHAATAVVAARGKKGLQWLSNASEIMLAGAAVDDAKVASLAAVDVDAMADAAALLSLAIEQAKLSSFASASFPPVVVGTPIGKIVVRATADDTYDAASMGDSVALLVDLGGNDAYEIAAGAANLSRPVSVVVDGGGNDRYGYKVVASALDTAGRLPSDAAGRKGGRTASRVGRQGSGVLGIGMLFDLGDGADKYKSLALSQGAAVLGVGVLYDEGGDDDYRAEVASQGAATWGLGLFIDRRGNDAYRSYTYSQGFGYVQGVAIAADGAGDDFWFVNPGDPNVKADPELPNVGGDPLYQSAQLPCTDPAKTDCGNNSMSQGVGQGRRADSYPDETYMGGGHGLLLDVSGNDRYIASVFAQGAGYYRGIGALVDRAGDDVFEGLWYVQGSSAHLAIGILVDESGNDRYNPTLPIRATSIGVANDFSSALSIDLAGDDVYVAPGLSLGSGYAQAISVLLNVGGNDSYTPAGYPTLGGATISGQFSVAAPRAKVPTIGVFADLGGVDVYAVPKQSDFSLAAGNDATWTYSEIMAQQGSDAGVPPSEKGAGLDQNAATGALP